jgi:hypothetical protein
MSKDSHVSSLDTTAKRMVILAVRETILTRQKCYADWGSQMKVDSITQALESVRDNSILLREAISY